MSPPAGPAAGNGPPDVPAPEAASGGPAAGPRRRPAGRRDGGRAAAPGGREARRGRERAGFQAEVEAAIARSKAYPPAAASRGVAGDRRIEVSVARDGRLLRARLVRSSGSPILDRAGLAAARQARLPAAPPGCPGESFRFEVALAFETPGR